MPETGLESQAALQIRPADVKHHSERDDELELLTAEGSPSKDYVQQQKSGPGMSIQGTQRESVCVYVCVSELLFAYVCVWLCIHQFMYTSSY